MVLVASSGFCGMRLELRVMHTHKHYVHIQTDPNTREEWLLSIVYVSPKPNKRAELWNELEEIHTSSPWCTIWDFNFVLSHEERNPMGRVFGCFQG